MTKKENIDAILSGDDVAKLGVIGSPSFTSELTLDILGSAVTRKLVGELALFQFEQDKLGHYALGQLTEIEMRNVWQQDPTMRSLVRQRGFIETISKRHDNHLGKMIVSAVFSKSEDKQQKYSSSNMGTVPHSGTEIYEVTDTVLNELLHSYKDQLFYLGNVYGSKPNLPMWFKHFGTGVEGAGEAYHLGIFGRTGSGKSVLATMILTGYLLHKNMSFLVIDPQGEFAKDMGNTSNTDKFDEAVKKQICKLGGVTVMNVMKLVLDRWELFTEILYESSFLKNLTIKGAENRRMACDTLESKLKEMNVPLKDLSKRATFDKVWNIFGKEDVQEMIYSSSNRKKQFDTFYKQAKQDDFHIAWNKVAELFNAGRQEAKTIDSLLRQLFEEQGEKSKILVIDLSGENTEELFWNEKIQSLVVRRLLHGTSLFAEKAYKRRKNINALVLIDEAHRFAPRASSEEDNTVRSALIDAVRTTRKYGLGWMFISQTLHSLHREILNQIRIWFIGFGLGHGQELQTLKEIIGDTGSAIKLYQSFLDPHSTFESENKQYSFMTIGPVSPLSFSGTPLFLNVFNTPEAFTDANKLNFD